MAGNNLVDTAGSRPGQALTVTVRQPDGTRAVGATVRFQSLTAPPPRQSQYPVLVASLADSPFQTFVVDTTDSMGAAAAVIGFNTLAGVGQVEIHVPTLGYADTARYTVTSGNVTRVTSTPPDTVIAMGATVQIQAVPQDAWANPRQDPVVYTALGPGITVNETGLITATATGAGRVVTQVGNLADTVSVAVMHPRTLTAYRASGNPGIVRIGVDGASPAFLAPAVVTAWPTNSTWNSAGTHVVFASSDRLYTVAATGGNVTRLIEPPVTGMMKELTPQIARSAGTVFLAAVFGSSALSIWRTDSDGSNPTEILANPSRSYRQPAPSPDGTRVAVVETDTLIRKGDETWIRVFDVGSGTMSSWALPGISPEWSPAGDQIVYYHNAIRVVNADGTGDRAVSPPGREYNLWGFSWSPDAQWIIAKGEPGGLELIEASTGIPIPIRSTGNYFYPAWKP